MLIEDQLRVAQGRLDIAALGVECDSLVAMDSADIGCFFDNAEHRVLG